MKFLFVLVLLVCTNLFFCQRGNAITGSPVRYTTFQDWSMIFIACFFIIYIHLQRLLSTHIHVFSKIHTNHVQMVALSNLVFVLQKACGSTSKCEPTNIHIHCSSQEKVKPLFDVFGKLETNFFISGDNIIQFPAKQADCLANHEWQKKSNLQHLLWAQFTKEKGSGDKRTSITSIQLFYPC